MDVETGILETVSGSIEDPEYPPEPGYIRGTTKILATRLTPNNDHETDVVTISMVNMNGKIPNDLKLRAGEHQASRVKLIEKTFKTRFCSPN